MVLMVQLLLISVWGATLVAHLRRLFRLAVVPVTVDRSVYVRNKARRIWWWLGRDEFWTSTRRDVLRCLETTAMIALVAVGF
jgi:hypothetical protein